MIMSARVVGCVLALACAVYFNPTLAVAANRNFQGAAGSHVRDLCVGRDRPVPSRQVPPDVFGVGQPVIGKGSLWVLSHAPSTAFTPLLSLPEIAPVYDVSSGAWYLKFPWFRRRPGPLTIAGRRVDGPGQFRAEVHNASYPPTGTLPTTLHFSTGGCWKLVGRQGGSQLVIYLSFSSSVQATCVQLHRQLSDIELINNTATMAIAQATQAALRSRAC
jgi:hypothetical protein